MSKCCTHVLTFRSIIPPGKSNYSLLQFVSTSFNTGYFWPHFLSTRDLAAADGRVRVTGGQSGGCRGSEDVYCSAEHQWSGQHRDGKTIDKTMSYLKMGRCRYFWKWWGGQRRWGWTRGNKGVVPCRAQAFITRNVLQSNFQKIQNPNIKCPLCKIEQENTLQKTSYLHPTWY